MFFPDDEDTTLTSTELERALTFYALQGGIERHDGDILHALYSMDIALPSVAVVDRLVELTAAGDIEGLADLGSNLGGSTSRGQGGVRAVTSFYRKRSVELASIQATGSSGNVEEQLLMSLGHPQQQVALDTISTDDDDEHISRPFAVSRGMKRSSAPAPVSRFVTQREWIALLTVLKRCFAFSVEHAGALAEEKNSFAAIAMAAAEVGAKSIHRSASSASSSSSSSSPANSDEENTGEMIIASEKLQAVFANFGLTFDVDAFMSALDENGDGSVDFNEFLALVSSTDDALESFLPAFVACGGREVCVNDRGFVKPPSESSVADDTALLLTVRELQKNFPYLPAHVFSQVPANHYHSHHRQAISTSTKQQQQQQRRMSMPTNAQRALMRSFLPPEITTTVGGGSLPSTAGNGGGAAGRHPPQTSSKFASPLTKSSGSAQQQQQRHQVPFDCDPAFVTLQRFAKMMHLWGKRPRDLNIALQEQMRVLSQQRAAQMQSRTRNGGARGRGRGVAGSSSSLRTNASSPTGDGVIGENAMALLVRACREIEESGGNLHSDFDQNLPDTAPLTQLQPELSTTSSTPNGHSATDMNNMSTRGVPAATSHGRIMVPPTTTGSSKTAAGAVNAAAATFAASATASTLDVITSVKENQQRRSTTSGNSPGELHIEHTTAIGARAIAGAAETALSKHYQRIVQHRSDVNEAPFRDIQAPKRLPRFSPKRGEEDRVPLHEPKRAAAASLPHASSSSATPVRDRHHQPRTPPRSSRRWSASAFDAASIASPDAENPHGASPSAATPNVSTAPRVVVYSRPIESGQQHATPRVVNAGNAASGDAASVAAAGSGSTSLRSPMPPMSPKPTAHHQLGDDVATSRSRQHQLHDSGAEEGRGESSSVARSDTFSSAAAALFTESSAQRPHRSPPHSNPRNAAGVGGVKPHHRPPPLQTIDAEASERDSAWWTAMRGKLLDKKQLRDETTHHLAHMHQWARSQCSSTSGLTGSSVTSPVAVVVGGGAVAAAALHQINAATAVAAPPSRTPSQRHTSSASQHRGERVSSSSLYTRGPHPAAPTLHVPTRPNTAGRHGRPTSAGRHLNSHQQQHPSSQQQQRENSPVLLKSPSPPLINHSLQHELINATRALKGKQQQQQSAPFASAPGAKKPAISQQRGAAVPYGVASHVKKRLQGNNKAPESTLTTAGHHQQQPPANPHNLHLEQPVLPSPSAAAAGVRGRRPTVKSAHSASTSPRADINASAAESDDDGDDGDVEFLCASDSSPRSVIATARTPTAGVSDVLDSMPANDRRLLVMIGAHCALRRIQKWWRSLSAQQRCRAAAHMVQRFGRGLRARNALNVAARRRAELQLKAALQAEQLMNLRRQKARDVLSRVVHGYAARRRVYEKKCDAARLEEEHLFDDVFFVDDDVYPTARAPPPNINVEQARSHSCVAPLPKSVARLVADDAAKTNSADDDTTIDNDSGAGTAFSQDAADLFGSYFPVELLRSAGLPAPPQVRSSPPSSLPPHEEDFDVVVTAEGVVYRSREASPKGLASLGSPRSLDLTSGVQSPLSQNNGATARGGSDNNDAEATRHRRSMSDLVGHHHPMIAGSAVTASWESDESSTSPNARLRASGNTPTRAPSKPSYASSNQNPSNSRQNSDVQSVVAATKGRKAGGTSEPSLIFVRAQRTASSSSSNSRGGGGTLDAMDPIPLEPISSLTQVASATPSTPDERRGAATIVLGVPLVENPFGIEEVQQQILPASRRISRIGDLSQMLTHLSHGPSTTVSTNHHTTSASSFGKAVDTIVASIDGSHRRPSTLTANALGTITVASSTLHTGSARRSSSEVPSSLLAYTSEVDRLMLLDSPVHHEFTSVASASKKFDGFAAPLTVYRVMRGYHIRKKIFQLYSRRVYSKPLQTLQRLGRGYQRRRRLGDQRWAIADAKSTIANWMHRDSAATIIQCCFRQARAKQLVRATKTRALNRINIRTSAEGVTIVHATS